ncbi:MULTISPECIES: hypothetical protein [unclassified Vibrio]|uniref:Uncharacterized protein n=1 Tax=Vibrio sp. HB236076 TaxID=3232307 RepID=A0AB39HJD1_9VIBR|nr:hypothetical protein [Vibrio sp. HB161653]MDP5253012.1 hypothetical protein [Vibrio sp. HB161653]
MLYAVTNLKEFDVVKANSYVCGVARPCSLLEVYEYEIMQTDYCRIIDLMEHHDGINYQLV